MKFLVLNAVLVYWCSHRCNAICPHYLSKYILTSENDRKWQESKTLPKKRQNSVFQTICGLTNQFNSFSCRACCNIFSSSPGCSLIWMNLVPSTSVQCNLCLVFLWLPLLFLWSFTLWHLLPFAKETLKHKNCPLNNMITLSLIYFIVCCKCLQCYTLGDLWQADNSFLPGEDVWNSTVLQRAQSFLCNFAWPEFWPCLFWLHPAPWLIPLWWTGFVTQYFEKFLRTYLNKIIIWEGHNNSILKYNKLLLL